MATLREFANSMTRTAKTVGVNAIVAVKEVSKAVGVTVVYATPVDTSRARMNWQGSVNLPKAGVLSPAPAIPGSSSEGPRTAIKSINEATGAYNGQQGGVWITNNLNYIQSLNNGSSSQAPANFVEQSVLVGVNSISKVKLLP